MQPPAGPSVQARDTGSRRSKATSFAVGLTGLFVASIPHPGFGGVGALYGDGLKDALVPLIWFVVMPAVALVSGWLVEWQRIGRRPHWSIRTNLVHIGLALLGAVAPAVVILVVALVAVLYSVMSGTNWI